jgi:hypothetical protein
MSGSWRYCGLLLLRERSPSTVLPRALHFSFHVSRHLPDPRSPNLPNPPTVDAHDDHDSVRAITYIKLFGPSLGCLALPCPALALSRRASPCLRCFFYSLASTERAAALRRPTHGPHPQTEHLLAGRDIRLRLSAPAPSLFSRLLAGARLCHF